MKNRTLKVLSLLASAIGFSACGTSVNTRHIRMAPSSSYMINSSASSSNTTSGCNTQNNITPDHDVTLDGRDYFTACAHPTDTSKFTIAGESSSGNQQLCVFPAQRMSNGQVWVKKDTSGMPLVLCGLVDAEKGSTFQFANTNYNSLFVVPVADRIEMTACLGANSPTTCPNYSFGSFR